MATCSETSNTLGRKQRRVSIVRTLTDQGARLSLKIAEQVSHHMWPKDESSATYRNGRRNELDGGVWLLSWFKLIWFILMLIREIDEVEDKIAALEAQSANVHDEPNAHKGRHKGCCERSRKNRVAHRACSLGASGRSDARKVLAFEQGERRGGIREVTRTLKKRDQKFAEYEG